MRDMDGTLTQVESTLAPAQTEAMRIQALYVSSVAAREHEHNHRLYSLAKRAFDIAASTLLLVALSPLLVAIMVMIKLSSPGPAILTQERVGQGGRVFGFLKFRSMYDDPDRTADIRFAQAYINGDGSATARAGGIYKPAHDKRITPIGRWLRKTSLDELPQLLNILHGDMSLVGPRPSMPYEVEVYKPRHFRRLEVMPGLTGLAQINGRSSLPFEEIVSIDIEYIEQSSFWLDLQILLKTLPVVLSGNGAR
jgi:lipopolysaccharide/colanic/teichoic acid biosynthesis glycosyltransferase